MSDQKARPRQIRQSLNNGGDDVAVWRRVAGSRFSILESRVPPTKSPQAEQDAKVDLFRRLFVQSKLYLLSLIVLNLQVLNSSAVATAAAAATAASRHPHNNTPRDIVPSTIPSNARVEMYQ
jgi:hypothetical protein